MYFKQGGNGYWKFRRRIPKDVLGMVDPRLFDLSLGTQNRKDALKFYAAALTRSEQEISNAREKIRKASEKGQEKIYPTYRARKKALADKAKQKRSRAFCQYDERAIDSLVSRWFEREKHETETLYRDAFMLNTSDELLEIAKGLNEEEMHLMDTLSPMRDMVLFGKLRSILDAEDCDLPREGLNDPLFRRLYGLMLEGLLYLNQIALSLVQDGKLPERFQKLPVFTSAVSHPVLLNHAVSGGPTITLDELITRFENDPKRQSLRAVTRKEYALPYRALREEIGGETPILQITRDQIKIVADTFRHLPSRATLTDKSELKTIANRAKVEGKPLADVKTFNKKVHQLSAIFKFAEDEQWIPSNPARSLALLKPPSSGEGKSFSPEHLNLIFSGSLFQQFMKDGKAHQFEPNHPLRPCLFWSPLIALFHGMRAVFLALELASCVFLSAVSVQSVRFVFPRWKHPTEIRLAFQAYKPHN